MNERLVESIKDGILLEDNNSFLRWNESISKLSRKNNVRKEKQGDRTIFHWGEHRILNGLSLELFSFYWNYRIESIYKKFKSIEFRVVGDEISQRYFTLIREHIEAEFGKGLEDIISDADKLIKWNVNGVVLQLCLFEQFVYKLDFKISLD